MLLTGFLVGLPLYYNAGFVILVPLVFSIAKKTKLPLLYLAIPMAASLSTTHCFLPPHPGPVVLVNAFKADLGKTLLLGLILVIPIVIVAGPLLGRMLQNISGPVDTAPEEKEWRKEKTMPAVFPSFMIALLPVILITISVIAKYFLDDGMLIKKIISFIGDSTIALLISVICSIYFLGIRMGEQMPVIMKRLSDAISGIAVIMLIITAGGVLKTGDNG
jgi:Gnt-I system high-affinity gluconate transporter